MQKVFLQTVRSWILSNIHGTRKQRRTGSSDELPSSAEGESAALVVPCLPFRGLEMPSTKTGAGVGVVLRAMTFGTAMGVTSDARPTRRNRDPGCMTRTAVPRLAWCSTLRGRREPWLVLTCPCWCPLTALCSFESNFYTKLSVYPI